MSETFEREGKTKAKKWKSNSDLGELIEFLSKRHEDQMEIH